ncbi:hypothetical protein ACHAW6_003451 [Cyclotella cf. meneghiniana]
MVDRNTYQHLLTSMLPIIKLPASCAMEQSTVSISNTTVNPQSQTKSDMERLKDGVHKLDANFPPVPSGEKMCRLSDDEFKELVASTNSYEKERALNLVTALQAQLKEYQSMLDRLAESELERTKLAERNRVLEKENDERLKVLEGEVICLKMELATEKGMIDHSRLSVLKLTARNETLERENESLRTRLSRCVENGDGLLLGTDFKLRSDKDSIGVFHFASNDSRKAVRSLSAKMGRRVSGERTSSAETLRTEISSASEHSTLSDTSDDLLCNPKCITKTNILNGNVKKADSSIYSSKEIDKGGPSIDSRFVLKMRKNRVRERVLIPQENANDDSHN